MSLLSSIRKRSWLIFLVIGLSLFVFIIDPKIFFSFFEKESNVIGIVNGENIYDYEYIDQINFQRQLDKNIPDNFLKNQVWNNLINEKIFIRQAKKLGLEISEKDFWETIANNSIYSNIPTFLNNNGSFNLTKFKYYVSSIEKKSKKIFKKNIEENKFWNFQKKIVYNQILINQYFKLILEGINTGSTETIFKYYFNNAKANIDYIYIPYNYCNKIYNTKNINISDYDIRKYILNNSKYSKEEPVRDLIFVIFPNKASKNDISKLEGYMVKTISDFKKTLDNNRFISIHSDYPYNESCYSEEILPDFLVKNFLLNAKIGNIYGPFLYNNNYCIIKLINKKKSPDYIKSKHILISYRDIKNSLNNRSKKNAKKIVKYIYNKILLNYNYFNLYDKKSDDIKNINKKNDLKLLPEYQKFLNQNKKGKIGIINTELGYCIIQITDKIKSNPCYELGVILKSIKPSNNTTKNLNINSYKFIKNNKKSSEKTFIKNAYKNNYLIIKANDVKSYQDNIENLFSDADSSIIDWAFNQNRKVGDIKIFTTINGSKIISYLSEIHFPGTLALEKVKNEISNILQKEKLSEIIFNNINNYKLKSLEELSSILKINIIKNKLINYNNPIVENFIEPRIIGNAFSLPLKTISNPISGKKGIFIIRTNNRTDMFQIDIKNNKYNQNFFQKKCIESIVRYLRNKAIIKDYRNDYKYHEFMKDVYKVY